MNSNTANQLIELNRQFYQTFASQFSATRQRLQPGVKQILGRLPTDGRLLDLGCGNGELWRALADSGFNGLYIGLDFSPALLDVVKTRFNSIEPDQAVEKKERPRAIFLQADLSEKGWDQVLPRTQFDAVLAFAVLHHLPDHDIRAQVLDKVQKALAPEGHFYHSEWQFLNSSRLRARIQPWSRIGLSDDQVDPGDYLLDWRRGGYGLRYAHHFSEDELTLLAHESGFKICETFYSDGEGGQLGLYQTWTHDNSQKSRRNLY